MLTLFFGVAFAAPTPALDHQPPATVHLATRAAVLDAKAAESGDACDLAAASALEDLYDRAEKLDLSTLVSVTLQANGDETCKQRRTGDTVLQSVVQLDAIAIAEDPSLPEVATERAITVLATLGAADGGLDQVQLEPLDGHAWWRAGGPLDADDQDDEADPMRRAAGLLVRQVLPDIGKRGPLLATTPEVAGAIYVFEAGKRKSYRGLRIRVPAAATAEYLRGALTDDGLVAALAVDSRSGTDPWVARDPRDIDLKDSGGQQMELRDVDVDEADLEGLEDEEDSVE